jgi:formylglycine-generating enzyme required for sulfatase activity
MPLAAIEEPWVIPRGGLAEGGPDAATEIDTEPLFSDLAPIDARAAPPRRASWPRRALWLCATILLLIIAWLYGRPSTTTAAAGAATGKLNGAVTAAQSPAPAPAPAPPGSTFQDCPTCPKMIVLPTGRFKQGAPRDERDALPAEKPQHIVLIRQPLAISTTELTVSNFREFVTATRRELAGCDVYDGEWQHKTESSWLHPGFTQNSDHPVTCVSWNDAVAYAEWLSAKTGHHYRLPSSSEWEYAARAGVDAALPWNPAMQAACEHANVADRSAARRYPKWSVFACKDGYVNTAPVASFKANAFGIYDMLGNVLEWTQDCWHDDYSKAPVDGSARLDGACVEHELRGGSWFSSPAFVRLSYRNHSASGYRSSSVGVRLVRDMR